MWAGGEGVLQPIGSYGIILSKFDNIKPMAIDRDIARALLKLHILSRSANSEVHGLGLIQRFREMGVELSPGTVYPVLSAMIKEGDLKVRPATVAGRRRLLYRATRKGREELRDARRALKSLSRELFPGPR